MKTFTVTIEIIGLCGTRTADHEIKAKTMQSAERKAYAIIGNQSGTIKAIKEGK